MFLFLCDSLWGETVGFVPVWAAQGFFVLFLFLCEERPFVFVSVWDMTSCFCSCVRRNCRFCSCVSSSRILFLFLCEVWLFCFCSCVRRVFLFLFLCEERLFVFVPVWGEAFCFCSCVRRGFLFLFLCEERLFVFVPVWGVTCFYSTSSVWCDLFLFLLLLLLLLCSQLDISWVHHFGWDYCVCDSFLIQWYLIEVVTFCLRGWCCWVSFCCRHSPI